MNTHDHRESNVLRQMEGKHECADTWGGGANYGGEDGW